MSCLFLFFPVEQPSSNDLDPNQDIDGEPDAMMWIRQASLGANCHEAQDDDHRAQQKCEDLKPYVQP
jgi:hypothetical protein